MIERLRKAVFDGPGELAPALRRDPPEVARAYVEKVRRHAYRVVDADVHALREAGWSDEQIFELTVATALAVGLERPR